MVLDELESAAGIHNHDCVTGSPRSAGGGGGGDDDSWSNELLRRGWDLTRKAAIAAAAATAAPPLIVLSAAGVALSVPFAAYLASLAATDHLMGALLRSCQPPSQPYSREEYDDLEQEFLDAPEGYGRDAPASGHFDAETEQGIVEEENVRDTSLPLSRDPGVSEATAPWFAEDDVQGEFSTQESGRDSYTSNSGNTLLPVSRDPVVSEAPAPSFADDQVEKEEEVEGEISAQESGQDSYASNRSDETVGHTPMGLGVAALAKPLFAEEGNVVQKEGGGEFSVLNSDQQLLQSNDWIENEDGLYSKNNEEDDKSMEENKSANEMMQQGFYFPESRVPAAGYDDNVVQEKVEDEFSVQNSGQQQSFQFESRNFGEKEEDGKTMEENKPSTVLQQTPAFTYFDTEKEQAIIKEEEESDTLLRLSQDPGVSEGSAPAFTVEEEVQGEFSAQTSGQDSYTSNRGDDTSEYTPMEGRGSTQKETQPGGFGVSASAKPLFPEEHNVAQEKGNGEEAVEVSGQQSFQSNISNEKEDDVYPKKEEGDGKSVEETKSMEVMNSQGSYFPKSSMPASGDEDNKAKGEFSVQDLGQYSLLSDIGNKKDHDITMEEKKSTEDLAPRDIVGSGSPAPVLHGEDNAVQSEEGFEVAAQGVLEEPNSNTDVVMAEVVDAQVEIIATAAPESEVLPPSSDLVMAGAVDAQLEIIATAAPESEVLPPSTDLGMAEVVDMQVEIIATAAPDTEALSPSNLVASELHPDLVTREDNDVYVAIVAAAEPESEVLHESNLVVCASTADLGTGVGKPMEENKPTTVSQEAPAFAYFDNETEQAIIKEEKESDTSLLLSQDPGVSEASAPVFALDEVEDELQGEFSDQTSGQDSYTPTEGRGSTQKERLPGGFGVSASAKPLFAEEHNVAQEKGNGEEAVQVSGQQSFQSNIWNEKEIDVYPKKEGGDGKSVEENKSMEETVSQGFCFPRSHVPPSGEADDNVVQENEEGEFSAGILGQQSFQTKNGSDEKEEEDGKTMEENKSAKETVPQGFYFPESLVPASGDDDNVVQEKGEDEFSVQNSSQQQSFQFQSKNFGEKEEEGGNTMEENKPTTVSQEAPVFAYFDAETEQAIINEEEESDTSLPLSLDSGVSEASAPAFAIDEVEEVQGEFPAQTSGQDSYTSNRGGDAEDYTPMEGKGSTQKETLKGGFGVSGSAKPLFAEEHNVAQEKGNGEEAVQVSGQQSFQLNIYNEKEDDVYLKKEGDGQYVEENKSMEETVSQGLPPSGKADDNVVQEKEDGEFSAGILGQQSFQTKNGSDEKEEDGKTTEENKSAKNMVPQGFYESCVPASDEEDNVVQEKREGEYSVQKNSDQLPLQSKIWNDKEEEGKTIEENKSTEPTHSQGSYFPKSASGDEDIVVNEKAKGDFSVQDLGQYSLLSDIGDKKEHDITMEEKKSTKELAPQDLIGSGSPAPVLHSEDNAVQRKEGFEVAAQGIPEEANSNTDLVVAEVVDVQVETIATVAPQSEVLPPTTDLVMAEVANVQVEIIATAAPESEVLPPSTDLVIAEVVDVQLEIIPTAAPDSEALSPSNLVARELHPDLVTGEVNDVYVASVTSTEPESNLLHESNLVVCASTAGVGTGEISDVQVNVVSSAKPEDEALQLSNLASCESQAVVETAHVGDIIGIAAMEDIVWNVDNVNKEDMLVPVASMHDTEDVISSGSTPYFSTMGDEITDLLDQSNDVGYTVMNEAIGGRVVAHGEAHCTEEQLREQLDTIKTITGYDAVPSSTLEGELAGLYIFVGVEPPVGSSDSSDPLMEFSAKLRFLKSIIGVE